MDPHPHPCLCDAIRLLKSARDLAQREGNSGISLCHAQEIGERFGIDEDGLSREDRKILEALIHRGRPAGIGTIAAKLGMDSKTVEVVHEPFLVYRGYIDRTWHGRVATGMARLKCGVSLGRERVK